MEKEKKQELFKMLAIQSSSYNQFLMFAYIIRRLKKIGCDYYTFNGCIYAIKGKSKNYPCIVSHMDTVHDIAEDITPVEINGNIIGINKYTMEQTGIGGDDKAGIFIALECMEQFNNIKAVFFRDEEVGCEGSYDPDIDFFKDCNFVLQCDRNGNKDFIINASGVKLSSKNFQKDVKPVLVKYGYSFNNGMMTDVMALKESGIKCSMANISCGYYKPHTPQEYININDLVNCMEMVKDIIKQIGGKSYLFEHVPAIKRQTINWNDIGGDYWRPKKQICECCNEQSEVKYIWEFRINMCDKCIEQYAETNNYKYKYNYEKHDNF